MAEYMARVELFRADGEDYADLHEKMESLGLKRTVRFDDGKTYDMPIGTYFGTSSLSTSVLRDRVKSISDPLTSRQSASIFLCRVQDQEWSAFLYEA